MVKKLKLKKKKVCLIVTSKVKGIIKAEDLRSGKDFLEALSDKVQNIVDAAIQKTKEEGKKITLGAEDVPA
jgi:hypothetical protein